MPSNSFMGTSTKVGNTGVRSVIDELMHFRTQITRKDEIKAVGGWSDPLNHLLAKGLGRVRTTLALITHDPLPGAPGAGDASSASPGQADRQAALEGQAADEDARLVDLYNAGKPISADNIQMPANSMVELPYDFSGANPDYPQLSDPIYKNVFLKQFVSIMDLAVHDLSNLACASYGDVAPKDQSAMIHARLNQAFTVLQTKGGAVNRPIIADGTDPDSLVDKVGAEINTAPESN